MRVKKRYTIPDRLPDVIRLITVLSVDEHAFRTTERLEDAIRGLPGSASSWLEIADLHPEFFRSNGERTAIALLIRSYLPQDAQGKRARLSIEETQKLIGVAVILQEKEIQWQQRNSHRYPLLIAVIALVGSLFSTIYTQSSAGSIDKKIDSLIGTVKQMQAQLATDSTNKNKPSH